MSAEPVKVVKVQGMFNPDANWMETPERDQYAELCDEPMNPMGAERLEDVFTPHYDRAGFTTDNAKRRQDGRMWKIRGGDATVKRMK